MNRRAFRVGSAAIVTFAAFAACLDPVQEDAIARLGPEVAGIPRGPLHRSGQPCGVCHGGNGPADVKFSLAGTVYVYPDGSGRELAENATVKVTDAKKKSRTFRTNAAGNFFVRDGEWDHVYPLKVEVSYRGETQKMTTHIGREASCGFCHVSPPGPDSPGRVYARKNDVLAPKPTSDSGAANPDGGAEDAGAESGDGGGTK